MIFRLIPILLIAFFIMLLAQPVCSDEIEDRLREHEARLIYESAGHLVENEEYDRAVGRYKWIMSEYPETEYARLSADRVSEVESLKFQPKPISGISRASLVSFGALFTTWLGFGSWLISDSSDSEVAGVVLIASSLSGLAGSMILTDGIRLSDGQASLINFGGMWGIWQATGAAYIADLSADKTIGASMAGGIIGIAVSGSIVRGRYIPPGAATMINFGGIWGTWFAICGAMMADVEDGDDILTSSMIGGDAGLFTMAALSSKIKMSRSRARLINVGGIIGALYGLGTNVLFEIESKRDFWSVLTAGSILGLAAGTYLTRNYDREIGYFTGKITDSPAITPNISTAAIRHVNHCKRRAWRPDFRVPIFICVF